MADAKPLNWFVAQYKKNSYLVAKKNLENQGLETFLPLVELTRRNNTKFFSKLRPLFPGYIFIAFDLHSFNWEKINNTIGLNRIIATNTGPKCVPSDFINNLRSRCDLNDRLKKEEELMIGTEVEILRGPFANMIGTIESLEPQKRVSLLFEIMGRKTKTVVSTRDIGGIN